MEEREIKDQAIVLKSEETGEADRFITLLTSNYGKIKAKIRGVKKAKAKLAYASFPFNFGEYLLIRTGRSFTVTNCSFIDNFQALTYDLNKYYAGAGMLEIADFLSRDGESATEVLITLLKSLKSLCYNKDVNIFAVLSKFLVEVLKFSGFKLGVKLDFDKTCLTYFDFSLGKLSSEQTAECVLIPESEQEQLITVIESGIDDYDVTNKVSKTILKLLVLFFENKVDEEIKIIKRFI